MNKTNLSSSTECKSHKHYTSVAHQIMFNIPLSECDTSPCICDTTTQGDDSKQLSKCCKAPIVTAHGCDSDLGHMGKPCTCEIVTMWYECTKCKKPCDLDIGFTALDSNTDSKKTYPTGDDSMKEQINKYLDAAYFVGMAFNAEKMTHDECMSRMEKYEQKLFALFQSQESKTLERVREKEIVICAAVITTDGEVFRGHRHVDCMAAIRRAGKEYPRTPKAQGFVTSRNRFVNRHDAADIQKFAKIPSKNPDGYCLDGELYSEDLY